MKKLFSIETFLFCLEFTMRFSMVFFATIFVNITTEQQIVISFFVALHFVKQSWDKQDLENKIFELKELIENLKK